MKFIFQNSRGQHVPTNSRNSPNQRFKYGETSKFRNINKYLKLEAEGLEGFFTGQILCIVALICWYLMVAKEAGGNFDSVHLNRCGQRQFSKMSKESKVNWYYFLFVSFFQTTPHGVDFEG